MKIGDLFIKLGLQKGEFDKGIDDAKKKTTSFGGSFKELSTLAVGAWAAIGTGAIMAFNAIKNSSDTLSTRWDIMIGGMTAGTNEFFRTLAIGDWSNFMTNLKDAVKVGREYVAMLDDIEEMQRSATMSEAKMLKENTQLEIDAADRTKTIAARKQAAEKRIKNEEDLAAKRIEIAKRVYDEEKKVTLQQTRLSGDQLDALMSDFDSVDKERSKEYNKQYDSYKYAGFTTKEIHTILAKTFTENEANYAKSVRQMGDTTDEQLNKMVDAYMKLAIAQESVIGNTRRIRIRLSGLITGEEDGAAKDNSGKAQLENLKKINDELEAQRILRQEFKGEKIQPLTGIGTPDQMPTNFMDTNQLQLGDMGDSWKANIAKNKKFTEEYLQDMKDFTDELNRTISSGIADAIGSLAEGLGQLAAGEISGGEFGKNILAVIGGFMKTLGGLMIAYAVNMALFAESAKNPLAWPVALAAGVALIAAGAAISSFASKGVSGGSASSVAASGYSNYSASSGAAVLSGNVVFELEGTKLRGALNNTDRRNTLIR